MWSITLGATQQVDRTQHQRQRRPQGVGGDQSVITLL
jgi:hypothetical protein